MEKKELIEQCQKFYFDLYGEIDVSGFTDDTTRRDQAQMRKMLDGGFNEQDVFMIVDMAKHEWIAALKKNPDFKPDHLQRYFREDD